ncbi:MAG: hypothetical protein ACKVOP_13950 [Sphingomonadaceae bacterium]
MAKRQPTAVPRRNEHLTLPQDIHSQKDIEAETVEKLEADDLLEDEGEGWRIVGIGSPVKAILKM